MQVYRSKYFGIYYFTHLCQKYRCSWNGFIKEFRSCWGEIGLVKRNVVVTHWRWNMAALVIFWAWISLSLNRIYKYVKMSLGVIWKYNSYCISFIIIIKKFTLSTSLRLRRSICQCLILRLFRGEALDVFALLCK